MRVLVVTWDGGGNTPPFRAVVEELSRRAHDVTVISEASAKPGWDDVVGVRFRSWGSESTVARNRKMSESERIDMLCRRLWFGPSSAAELRTVIETGRFDVCVLDHLLASCGAITESFGLPTAVLFHSVRRATLMAPPRFQHVLPGLNDLRAANGLPPLARAFDAWDFAGVRIICSARAFDAPTLAPQPGDLYVGPIAPYRPRGPAPELPGDGPVVSVSFSTTWQAQVDALQQTISGLSHLSLRVLVTVGPEVEPQELDIPGDVVVTRFLPHHDVLPVTNVVVTHAGHGTVMASLTAGVPLVCLPMGRDQFTNAHLVEACGAGIQVAAADEIPAAVSAVLGNASYESSAREMASEIAREPGTGTAADAIEGIGR